MPNPHHALRQSCRAHNAYSLNSALSAAFSTRSRLRSDAVTAQKQEAALKRQPATSGSFSSFESISEQFRHGRTQTAPIVTRAPRQTAVPQQRARQQQKPASLADRQALVDSGNERIHVNVGTQNSSQPQNANDGPPRPSAPPLAAQPSSSQRDAVLHSDTQRPKAKIFKRMKFAPTTQSSPVINTTDQSPDDWTGHMQKIGTIANEVSRQKGGTSDVVMKKLKSRLDYEGRHITIAEPAMAERLALPWALDQTEAQGLSAMQRLELEITKFAAHVELTPAEKVARLAIATETRMLAEWKLEQKNTMTELFGSMKTGLALASSDIDIRVYTNHRNVSKFGPVMKVLYQEMVRSSDWMCVVFRDANFPIINAQHRATNIDVQLVSSHPTTLQQSFTAKYLAELPHLRSLYMLVHTMLSMRGLVNVFNGGIGSYGLLMMLVAALKRRSSYHPASVSEQLLHVIDFYTTFDTTKYGLTINPTPKTFLKHDGDSTPTKAYISAAFDRGDKVRAAQWAIGQTRPLQPYLLCLQDPANRTNDLGRKTNAIKHIQATFRHVGESLCSRMREVDECEAKGTQWEGESLIEPLVGRCHETHFERRKKVEEYGRVTLEANPGWSELSEVEIVSAQWEKIQEQRTSLWEGKQHVEPKSEV